MNESLFNECLFKYKKTLTILYCLRNIKNKKIYINYINQLKIKNYF